MLIRFFLFCGFCVGLTYTLRAQVAVHAQIQASGKAILNAVTKLPNGGYYIGGTVLQPSQGQEEQMIVSRLYANGDTVWTRIIGGQRSDELSCLVLNPDESVIAIGQSASFSSQKRLLVTKISPTGSLIWSRSVGYSFDDHPRAALLAADGGIVIACRGFENNPFPNPGIFVVKLDQNGILVWSRVVRDVFNEEAWGLTEAPNGELMVAANSIRSGLNHLLIIRFSPSGNPIWARTYRSGNSGLIPSQIVPTPTGGYLISGTKSPEPFILHIDEQGSVVRAKYIQSQSTGPVLGVTSSGEIMMAFHQNFNRTYLVKLDDRLNEIWTTLNENFYAKALITGHNDEPVMVGEWISGVENWGSFLRKEPGGLGGCDELPATLQMQNLQLQSDTAVLSITMPSSANPVNPDLSSGTNWIPCMITHQENKDQPLEQTLSLSPNPGSDNITISWAHSSGQMSLLLYDLWGKVIRSWEVSGLESHTADLSELPAGLYLVRLKESKEKLSSTRLQIIR